MIVAILYARSSVALSAFTWSCSHHHRPSPELYIFPNSQTETLYPLSNNSPLLNLSAFSLEFLSFI